MQYNYSQNKFMEIEKELPHFNWFEELKESEIKHHLKTISEYLMQIARSIQSINT